MGFWVFSGFSDFYRFFLGFDDFFLKKNASFSASTGGTNLLPRKAEKKKKTCFFSSTGGTDLLLREVQQCLSKIKIKNIFFASTECTDLLP